MTSKVGIVMGSDSDIPAMQEAEKILKEFGIQTEVRILSAHRTPELAAEFAKSAAKKGIRIIIAGAGMANHLAGAMAAHTVIPVIGVPLEGSSLNGLDALLSTVQMPPGIPVACVAVGKAGAKNAGFLAVQMLALSNKELEKQLVEYRKQAQEVVVEKNKKLQKERE
ncbi:MAG: 5-(carboxyamino)imidazole ribonucleotide mutase [Deltaproteobacteria bacterium]|nr:5-(carboxyamino)imidazole ribonucleotide mutase [Deltaproteobacteria bacterium]